MKKSVNKINYHGSLFYGKIEDHIKMHICNIYKFYKEELSVNIRACQQQSNRVDCGVYTVVNAFHLLSGVNISAKRICEDQMRPRLLKYLKSGYFNEFHLVKLDEKAVHCEETRLNLMYFAIRFP